MLGIGFNIKMFAGIPAAASVFCPLLLGRETARGAQDGRLAIATVVLLVISLSWVTVVDLTPAGQRPYVGSSG